MKGIGKGTDEWPAEDAQGKVCGKGPSSLLPSQPPHMLTNPEVLQTAQCGSFYGEFITSA